MSFGYEIHPGKRAVVATFRGHFSRLALERAVQTLWDDERYRTDYVGIVDISDASVGVAIEDFRAVVEWVRAHERISVARWAAVASTPYATACALLYQRAISDRQEFQVFSTWAAACRFIDVDLPPPAATLQPAVI